MRNAIISFVFASAIVIGSACSTAKDVSVKEKRNSDGTVVKTEKRVDDNGDVVIKKKKHRRNNDNDDKDVKVKVDKHHENDEPAIVIKKDG